MDRCNGQGGQRQACVRRQGGQGAARRQEARRKNAYEALLRQTSGSLSKPEASTRGGTSKAERADAVGERDWTGWHAEVESRGSLSTSLWPSAPSPPSRVASAHTGQYMRSYVATSAYVRMRRCMCVQRSCALVITHTLHHVIKVRVQTGRVTRLGASTRSDRVTETESQRLSRLTRQDSMRDRERARHQQRPARELPGKEM